MPCEVRLQRTVRTLRIVFAWILLATCSGCVIGPDSCRPATPVPDVWHQTLEDGEYVGSAELDQWWLGFNDPVLDQLIDCADDGNLDLYAALARIRQSRAQVCIARSARLPMVQNTGSFQNSLQSTNAIGFGGGVPGFLLGARDFWSTALELSWEPDVFGRVTRQIESACATQQANVEAYRDVLVMLYGDVASNYVRVRTTQAQLKFARQNVALQRRALELAKKRVDAGVSAILDQHQAESNLASTEAEIPPLETQLHQDLNRLAVLLGEYPGAVHEFLANPEPTPMPTALPNVVPCDLVRQRPDIRQAERVLAARCADLGVAAADLFPRFQINGSFGLQSQNFSDLFQGDSWTYNIGPSFSWPIFQGFQIKCNIESADAAIEEATANYEHTILRAVEEVENAVVGFNNERKRFESLQQTVEAAERTLETVLATYRAGKTDFQNVLDTLRTLFIAQNALAVSEGQIVQQLVTLYRALGGGWDPNHHCEHRCVRVPCPDRADPSVVQTSFVDDPAERYFGGRPTNADDETDKEGSETDDKSAADPDDDESTNDDPSDDDPSDDGKTEPLESLLQRKVEELEDRLQQKPSAEPPDSPAGESPSRPRPSAAAKPDSTNLPESRKRPESPGPFDDLLRKSDADGARLSPRDFWR